MIVPVNQAASVEGDTELIFQVENPSSHLGERRKLSRFNEREDGWSYSHDCEGDKLWSSG